MVLIFFVCYCNRTLQARSSRTNTFLGAPARRSKTVTLKIEGIKDSVSVFCFDYVGLAREVFKFS